MSVWKLIKLNFGRSPAHFGELGIGLEESSERVRSDTLFSAWLSAYARLLEKAAVEELLQKFDSQSEPPFRLSSTFIYQQVHGETVYYLPRPRKFPPNYPIGKDLDFAKDYKKHNYLPLEMWQRWYQSEQGFSENDLLELSDQVAYSNAFQIEKVPKIAVDRVTRATNLYHTRVVQYRCQQNGNDVESLSGLYFLIQFPDQNPSLENDFLAVLNFLGGEGIGGERSSGAGQFKVEALAELPQIWSDVVKFSGGNYHSLISLFWQHPLAKEVLENSSYELQERGGWITSSASGRQLRRKSVQMFAEGSVFPVQPQGKLANVTPEPFKDHNIYRSGISLSLPIKVEGE